MHSIWTGNLSFGLVTIPVKLVSAVKSTEDHGSFTLFCGDHHVPLHYKRWCEQGEHDVAWNDVVKGMEVTSRKYFLFTKEKLDSLKPSKTETIDIEGFYPHEELRTYWIDKHYFLIPGGSTALKPYRLLFEALLDTDKIAVATFVMHERQHVAAIQAIEDANALFLTTLHYAGEIASLKDAPEVRKPVKLASGELALAKEIVAKHSKKHLVLSEFKDRFGEKLKKLAHGKSVKVEQVERPEHKSLMEALRASSK